jgi:multidrug efflux system membrane fusion protein
VQPIASVALKTRIDATIDTILVGDGSRVKAGDVLVRLDDRQVQAQIKAAEAALAKDQVALEQNQRDMQRYQDLLTKGAGTQLNFDNARTSLAATKAQIMGDQAQLDNLKVQLGWYTISAPISGRVGTFAAKAGNIVRAGDNTSTGTLATIVQTTPIYVSFSVPQALLSDLRETLANQSKGAEVLATPQGATKAAHGKISVLDNTIDSGTGTISVRATFPNEDEFLWPGQLCNVRVVVRIDPQAVTIPRSAMQPGQNGNFVYVIENGVAKVRPVTLSRTQDDVDVVAEGLQGGETIVIDGALMLIDGARVEVRTADTRKGAI